MLHPALFSQPPARRTDGLGASVVPLLGTMAACIIAAALVPVPLAELGLLGAAAGLAALVLMTVIGRMLRDLGLRRRFRNMAHFVERDSAPSFATDADGTILYENVSAADRFGPREGGTLTAAFSDTFAAPAPLLHRLQEKARAGGSAREDVALRRGHVRLAVHRIGDDTYLWRIEDIADRAGPGKGADGLNVPMLTVSKSGTVLYTNDALRRLLGGRETALDRIVNDLPIRSGSVHEVAALDGPVKTTIYEIASAAGRRELYMMPAGAVPEGGGWQILDALPVPMLKIAPDGHVLIANRPARELLDHPVPAGTPLSELVEGLGRSVSDWLGDAAQGRGANRAETVRARAPEQDVFLQIALGRIDEEGEIALIAILNDTTELKSLEAQFVQSQKMQAIGQLAGGVAHDFNNLLTAISGHCDLLLNQRDAGDPAYGDLHQIAENANRAASLVRQLLAFSRKQNLQPELLDLRDTLANHTHLLNRLVGETVTLTVRNAPDLMAVRADKRQLEQVIMNLVVNARDAMPDGGEIAIETRMEDLAEPLRRDRAEVPPGRYVVVRVSDHGVGIAAENLPKIFEPFYTTKKTGEGTGLGLSTAYGIVKQSGGFIFADSAPGTGTSFTLYLPAHEPDRSAASAPVPAADKPAPIPPSDDPTAADEGVVLLVEDEAPVRAFASRALRMRGYTVIEAENAEEALKTLEDGALDVDVFVTDVIMPGMDGPSWVKQALEQRPDTRVVFVSGYAEDSVADSQARIPNSVFLPKPFSLDQLTDTVRNQLH